MCRIKLFSIAVIAGLVVSCVSIFPGDTFAQEEKIVRVLTSFYPVYIMVLNVAMDVPGVLVENLTPPFTGCLHDYSLTAADMKKIADADIFVASGAGMESFLDRVIAQYPKLKVATLTEGIVFIKEGKEANPHVWVSISNAIIEVKNLGKAMETFDPLHAELYRNNTSTYVSKLTALREKMQSELAPYKGRQIITFHEAFAYFAQEFGLTVVAVVERNPGSEPSAKELAETIDVVRNTGIGALFTEPQYPVSAAEIIAKETGTQVYILNPAVTGPDDPGAYIKIMEENLMVLTKALQ